MAYFLPLESTCFCKTGRTIQLWNKLAADALRTLSCKASNFRESVKKVINQAKWKFDENRQEMQ
jgi:hypothetical protein